MGEAFFFRSPYNYSLVQRYGGRSHGMPVVLICIWCDYRAWVQLIRPKEQIAVSLVLRELEARASDLIETWKKESPGCGKITVSHDRHVRAFKRPRVLSLQLQRW